MFLIENVRFEIDQEVADHYLEPLKLDLEPFLPLVILENTSTCRLPGVSASVAIVGSL